MAISAQPTEAKKTFNSSHFYSLDVLRGMAALAVVFWHWQHFSYFGTNLVNFDKEHQPLYFLFKPFYDQGYRAVDLFFCLSGFIFFWLYGEKISSRKTSLKEFVVLRFSRLYPLHFATLLLVAVIQQITFALHGSYWVYPDNDLPHFVLQALFASSLEQPGWTFNGPAWSISSEIFCYAVFFILCLCRRTRWWELILFIVAGYYLSQAGRTNIGHGIFSFFAGGIAFKIFSYLAALNLSRRSLTFLAMLACLSWPAAPFLSQHYIPSRIFNYLHLNEYLSIDGKDVIGTIIVKIFACDFELLTFPLTIITLALWEVHRGTLGKRLAFVGHISYSSYLLHFPLQMAFFGGATLLSLPRSVFQSPLSLLLFFAVLIPISLLSFRYFELPCQSRIRNWALRENSGKRFVVAEPKHAATTGLFIKPIDESGTEQAFPRE
jgi:peptidoglycan/LPS O-acetylase OafA/YrhL